MFSTGVFERHVKAGIVNQGVDYLTKENLEREYRKIVISSSLWLSYYIAACLTCLASMIYRATDKHKVSLTVS